MMFGQLTAALSDARARLDVVALQLAGNLVLLALAWFWLGMGVGSLWALAGLVLLAVVMVCLSALLHGSGLAAFRPMTLREAFGAARARLPRLVCYTLLALALLLAWDLAGSFAREAGQWAASAATFSSQSPVKPETMEGVYVWALRIAFVGLALLLHPVAGRLAGGIDSAVRVWKQPAYWLGGVVFSVFGLLLPWWLLHWVPAFTAIGMETASAMARFGAAYVLAVASWAAMAALMARLGREA